MSWMLLWTAVRGARRHHTERGVSEWKSGRVLVKRSSDGREPVICGVYFFGSLPKQFYSSISRLSPFLKL